MRILFISYWTCPLARPGVLTAGGMNIYVMQLANALGAQGHCVDIVTRSHKEDDHSVLDVHKNVRIIHFPSSTKNLYTDAIRFSQKIYAFTVDEKNAYDVIHAHYYYSGLAGLELKKKLRIPLLMTFHTLGILKEFYGRIQDKKRIESEKFIGTHCNAIIVSTDIERRDLIRYYHSEEKIISVIPPGVNHELFHPHDKIVSRSKLKLEKTKKIILFVGRIDPIKGVTFLIDSISQLITAHQAFIHKFQVLLIGGDIKSRQFKRNKEVMRIKKMIKQKKLESCIQFISSQPHTLLPYYYSAADLVVMPSVYESFGLVVLEALATGAPVIAARVGGLKYLISDRKNGRLFDSRNVKQLSDLIWELINDGAQRTRLGKSAKAESMRFCWEKQVKIFERIYKRTLSS